MSYERYLEDIVDTLEKAKSSNIKVNLLIGAGCSVTAGIPTAEGIIKKISNDYPREYDRADPKNYPNTMSKLTPHERRNLILEVVENSKVNWAHVAIAQLLKSDYVHRILTTNFDNLMQRACSLVGEYPAIYDLTTSNNFRTDMMFDKSVLHLHGQHTGFILCNTDKEVSEQAKIIKPVFDELNQNSIWIIVGYSGENDPIFQLLSEKKIFEYRLFWVGYKQEEPSEKLQNQLLSEEKYAFYVKDYDADSFFVTLAQKLKCFPPSFISKPFSYLSNNLDLLSEYPSSKYGKLEGEGFANIQLSAKRVINKAINTIESDSLLMAEHYLLAGLTDEVNKLDKGDENDAELDKLIITSLLQEGSHDNVDKALQKAYKLAENSMELESIRLLGIASLHIQTTSYSIQYYDFIIKICNLFSLVMKQTPSLEIMLFWKANIHSLMITYEKFSKEINNIEEYEKIIMNYFNQVEEFYPKHNGFKSSETLKLKDAITYISGIYKMLENGNFYISKKILDIYERQLQFVDIKGKPYIKANLGYWYFNNPELDLLEAEENGKRYYKEAIRLTKEKEYTDVVVNNSNSDKAFIQKYNLEYGKFCINRKVDLDDANRYIEEAISIGEIKGLSIYNEAVKLKEVIKSSNYSDVIPLAT